MIYKILEEKTSQGGLKSASREKVHKNGETLLYIRQQLYNYAVYKGKWLQTEIYKMICQCELKQRRGSKISTPWNNNTTILQGIG